MALPPILADDVNDTAIFNDLRGEAGPEVFRMANDGIRDLIRNFELGIDLIDVSAVRKLEFNVEDVKRRAVEILTTLLTNVQQDPMNIKYRSIGVENNKIKTQLLPAQGAWETLIGVGFVQDGDRLVLPLGTGSQKIEKYLAALKEV